MLRQIIIPAILVSMIGLPFIIPASKPSDPSDPSDPAATENNAAYNATSPNPASPFQLASSQRQWPSSVNTFGGTSNQPPSAVGINGLPTGAVNSSQLPISSQQSAATPNPVYDENGNILGFAAGDARAGITAGMTPDYGAAETYFIPGNAQGPDLSAERMSFAPVINFAEVFRYDVTQQWIRGRWDRVSTTPSEDGLAGYRVALVTGTNSWDLHGSLTYYFDRYHKCQRITFRGWAGDPSRLIQLLEQQHQFASQPTQYAGVYLSKSGSQYRGGLLMRHPTVMYAENRVQQVAVILEMNATASKIGLSDDFESLLKGSQTMQ